MNAQEAKAPAYEAVAREYYDPVRHPTCANFGELSEAFIAPRLLGHLARPTRLLDVGAGRSVTASILASAGKSLDGLFLLDNSSSMLAYSLHWVECGARAIVADARDTGLDGGVFDVVVSSLGDPYNQPSFWREVARLLRPGGRCIFTTPTHEWASRFRDGSDLTSAEFVIGGGDLVRVPSFTMPHAEQEAMMGEFDLEVLETKDYFRSDVRRTTSIKLNVDSGIANIAVVRGYLIGKPF